MRLLGTIVGWFFFAFFLLFALGAFLSGGILSGIFFLILAVLCSPLRKKIFEHLPDGVNRIPVKIGAGVLALILSFGFFPGSETTETSLQDVAVTADESTEDTVITERDRAAELAEKEAEKKAAEEAERKAAEAAEAERKAQEAAEAERKAQEEKAAREAEEAQRKAQEEAAAKEAEEAQRKAQEDAAAAERNAQGEAISVEQFQVNQPLPEEVAQERSMQPVMNAGGGGGNGNAANFNLYDNPEQQNTEDKYILNTNTKKIHFPKCNDVTNIKSENYATSNQSIEELETQGYKRCGHCNPF